MCCDLRVCSLCYNSLPNEIITTIFTSSKHSERDSDKSSVRDSDNEDDILADPIQVVQKYGEDDNNTGLELDDNYPVPPSLYERRSDMYHALLQVRGSVPYGVHSWYRLSSDAKYFCSVPQTQ